MSKADQIFINTCRDILDEGTWDTDYPVRPRWEDGSPAHTIKRFGVVNRYRLQEEFPMLTLRRTYWKSALDELLWIYQKKSNNVHELGSHVWDQWADENGSIGKAYGYQMSVKHPVSGVDLDRARELFGAGVVLAGCSSRSVQAGDYGEAHVLVTTDGVIYMDQVDKVLYDLRYNPASRRILTTTYIPADLTEMGLAPCAYSMTYNVTGNTLNAILNQRSQDMLAASNWNVVQYSFLLMLMAKVSGLVPGELVHVIADCHIYDRHVAAVRDLIGREPLPAPKVVIDENLTSFYDAGKDSFSVTDYQYHEFTGRIPVAV